MTVRRLTATVTATVVLAGLLAGCGGEQKWVDRCVTNAAGVIECAADQREPVDAVTGELLDGGAYDVAGERGKVVVVNFWGSWCSPCRAEAADLEATFTATKAKGVSFIGVNSRDDRDAAKAFERGRVTYPSLYDPTARVALKFDVTQASTPSTLILDRQGRIAVAVRRATIQSELQPLVERVAAEGTG